MSEEGSFVEHADGTRSFVEVKNGPAARLTTNQTKAYPAIQSEGFVPRGLNAKNAGFAPGVAQGPMPVRVVYLQ